MHLPMGEWVLLVVILGMVAFSLWEADKAKVAVLDGHKTKIRAYKEAMVFMWIPTVLLMLLLLIGTILPSALGLTWHNSWRSWGGVALALGVIGYFTYSVYSLGQSAEKRHAYRKAIAGNHDWMMPSNTSELRWFTLGLSVSAGICEELLFRGFLIGVLSQEIGIVTSVTVSSVLFGMCHLYQGWKNVLRTALVGLVLALIFVFTEVLWVVIALHIAVDVYGGIVGYLLNKSEQIVASELGLARDSG
ncbi:CPBP family intramembrane metalloprotease [Glaciecola sp. XM2]|uniref:CPBP family intramembrane glutamic endopeptidase n=1 Tax=Glaciecola sp. XM2 TaxID=1914931 RepID=UPI001BDEBBCA|nr:CPBP family intramembrane glutamic endopeptidase [Glaciecola sp. XM2]MBT1451305.1 CPBP family intramembrane metalloprotease [Glaciecola sp. XM2]